MCNTQREPPAITASPHGNAVSPFMEPLSIVTASGGLLRLCTTILTYAQKVRTVDDAVRALEIEINEFSKTINSFTMSLTGPFRNRAASNPSTGYEAQHWKNIEKSLNDCKVPLERLVVILKDIQIDDRFLKGPRTLIRLEGKSLEITALKQEIEAYRKTLQFSLQWIAVYDPVLFHPLTSKIDHRGSLMKPTMQNRPSSWIR